MKKSILSSLIFISIVFSLNAQKFTLSGSVKEADTGEDLIGATILIRELPGTGTTTNVYGYYSITLDQGIYTVDYQFVGFETQTYKIELTQNINQNVELNLNGLEIEEVVISAERADENVQSTKMSVTKLDPREVELIPVLFGERDLLKTIQLTPGVKSAGEGNSGFYVRGGGIDQNLILLDEAPVYNASHLLGFFSVFNSDAIKDLTLYKGGIPAEFGGRASSVMDIKMKDGNSKRYGLSGGIGLISSKLTFEGPIVKDKGSFILSGRRTYADVFLNFSSNEVLQNSTLYFYDLNAKANYQISEKDRLFVSGYFGRDIFGFNSNQFGFDWGNATGTMRWNHLFNEKMFSNTTLIWSDYDYKFKINFAENVGFSVSSGIIDYSIKQDFSWFPAPNHTIKFGLQSTYHTFQPGTIEVDDENGIFNGDTIPEQYALESGVYVQDEFKINNFFSLNYGLRYSLFNQLGPGLIRTYDADGNILTEENYGQNELIRTYGGIEPRVSAKLLLDKNSSLKLSITRNYQYLHQLSNSTTTSPTDIWVPSSINIAPQIGDQIALGYYRNFFNDQFESYVEGYYKNLSNLIDYRNGANLVLNENVESELVFGSGYAYGLEFFLKRKTGRLTGWLSYTYGRTIRVFDDINDGEPFPARQDRIHDLSLVLLYDISPRWKVSGSFIYYTGDAATFPSGRYVIGDVEVPYYTERNGYRFPDYHRADFGITYNAKTKKRFESSWNFSVYNFYAKENAFVINFQEKESNPGENEAVQVALFKIIPSISYNFKF